MTLYIWNQSYLGDTDSSRTRTPKQRQPLWAALSLSHSPIFFLHFSSFLYNFF
ncbi:hypothetical protein RchiOBHm_Chr7g0234251 [Rosa chinensis]|uniref:Uncharacterized protein n=1 Tax=Rosa chinensis TaxID=74649 RepID=A0A2P6PGD1_ROSCH|nr:hypothetical protein RchiOBHm_Chr7g0234251 [Rosa chinensis]